MSAVLGTSVSFAFGKMMVRMILMLIDNVEGGPNQNYSLTQYRLEWSMNFELFKSEQTQMGKLLEKIDQHIARNAPVDIEEVLKLVDQVSGLFKRKRGIDR